MVSNGANISFTTTIQDNSVEVILDDLTKRFPHEEGEGHFPVPGDRQDANGEWVDIPNIYKVAGFCVCYSDFTIYSGDCYELSESFMTADYVRDTTGNAIVIDKEDAAEAYRRYADEIIGLPFMTVRNPCGSGFMFLYMDGDEAPITPAGHSLFERLAAYLNHENQTGISGITPGLSPHRQPTGHIDDVEVEHIYV